MVRTGRVELPWPFGRQILSLVRLPIPPRSHGGKLQIQDNNGPASQASIGGLLFDSRGANHLRLFGSS